MKIKLLFLLIFPATLILLFFAVSFCVVQSSTDSNTVQTGVYTLPETDIVVDGNRDDWQSLPVFSASLPGCLFQTCIYGSDFKTLKLAKKEVEKKED